MLVFLLMISILPIQKAEASSQIFTDVPKNHPNYAAIMYLADQGVITKQKRFGPNDKVTREEVAIMVAKATGLNGTKTKTKFKDVPASRYSSGYINSAVNARIINGYPDGTFKPTQHVTRGHMAAFIANAFKLTKEKDIQFKDVPKGSTAYSAVRKLAFANITSGYPDGTFKPNQTLTRSHIAAFIARAMEPSFRPSKPMTQSFVTRKVYFGMTPKQVEKSESEKLISKTQKGNETFMKYNLFTDTGRDTNIQLTYSFEDNKLDIINFDLLAGKQQYINFRDLNDRFRQVLYEVAVGELGWDFIDTSDGYSVSTASWDKKDYRVILQAKNVGKNTAFDLRYLTNY